LPGRIAPVLANDKHMQGKDEAFYSPITSGNFRRIFIHAQAVEDHPGFLVQVSHVLRGIFAMA
jgi:hypothetical protein